jgi:hypothetical protein
MSGRFRAVCEATPSKKAASDLCPERPLVFPSSSSMALENIMAQTAHIADLERLEDEIDDALIQRSTDDPMIVDLKRRKLHLRDEIELFRYKPTVRGEHNELLDCRMAMLGLDPHVIECGDRETFDQINRRCTRCGFREACTVDLKRDPNNPVWESYCPNSATLNALTEAWWPSNIV